MYLVENGKMSQVELKNQYVSMRVEGGILYTTFAKGAFIDVTTLKKIENSRRVLLDGNICPVIVDFSVAEVFTHEAKHYTNSEAYINSFMSIAVIVDAKWKEMLANVYIKFKTFSVPMRVFSNLELAKEWSEQFLPKTTA